MNLSSVKAKGTYWPEETVKGAICDAQLNRVHEKKTAAVDPNPAPNNVAITNK